MTDSGAAIDKLQAELAALGVAEAYAIGDNFTLSVWIGLVISYQDGFYRWKEGAVKCRHLGTDPVGCATRVARRYHELKADAPRWWKKHVKGLPGSDVGGDR
ncbi:hypothetical protein [Rhizohabitans arisaemae]|uniref:hypothetical protein n=1 Tax=Rhizohabitans arisaemae TaxID=2720610 RepID=UPI0024B0C19A|nr:hypothetical protein [Rhizohabitans arisaemae]